MKLPDRVRIDQFAKTRPIGIDLANVFVRSRGTEEFPAKPVDERS